MTQVFHHFTTSLSSVDSFFFFFLSFFLTNSISIFDNTIHIRLLKKKNFTRRAENFTQKTGRLERRLEREKNYGRRWYWNDTRLQENSFFLFLTVQHQVSRRFPSARTCERMRVTGRSRMFGIDLPVITPYSVRNIYHQTKFLPKAQEGAQDAFIDWMVRLYATRCLQCCIIYIHVTRDRSQITRGCGKYWRAVAACVVLGWGARAQWPRITSRDDRKRIVRRNWDGIRRNTNSLVSSVRDCAWWDENIREREDRARRRKIKRDRGKRCSQVLRWWSKRHVTHTCMQAFRIFTLRAANYVLSTIQVCFQSADTAWTCCPYNRHGIAS